MSVVLLGGIKSLEGHYRQTAKKKNIKLKVFNKPSGKSKKAIASAGALLLFTGEVSHSDARFAYEVARRNSIPMVKSHNSSLNSLDKALEVFTSIS